MNKDQVEGEWKIMKGKLKQAWSKLTDNEVDAYQSSASGEKDKFYGAVQKHYGLAKEKIDEQIKEFKKSDKDSFAA